MAGASSMAITTHAHYRRTRTLAGDYVLNKAGWTFTPQWTMYFLRLPVRLAVRWIARVLRLRKREGRDSPRMCALKLTPFARRILSRSRGF